MRFDWYSATIAADQNVILMALSDSLQSEIRTSRGMHGYTQGYEVVHPERGVVARVLSGGNRGAYPHAWASGEDTMQFVETIRDRFPLHLVTRFDACEDFASPLIFEKLRKTLRKVARDHHLKFPSIEDKLNPGEGRTQYIGSRKSPHFARLYEKGKQLNTTVHRRGASVAQAINPVTGECIELDQWTRLELVVRPEGEGKTIATTCTPQQAWGFTNWTHVLAKAAFDFDDDRVFTKQHRVSEHQKAIMWMCKQYAKAIMSETLRLGGPDNFGKEIARQIQANIEESRIYSNWTKKPKTSLPTGEV